MQYFLRYIALFIVVTTSGLQQIVAQALPDSSEIVQFSGVVLTDDHYALIPLPYVNIYIESTRRGTFSSNEGFFSLVGRKGETVVFSSIGFKDVNYLIPDTLTSERYSIIQIMTKDTFVLPETVIYPWPSREHFKLEFLAMDLTDQFNDQASQNLSEKALSEMIAFLPSDGGENTDYYLRQQAQSYYYEGQYRPMPVMDVFAWKRFVEAVKRGDFKKKKE